MLVFHQHVYLLTEKAKANITLPWETLTIRCHHCALMKPHNRTATKSHEKCQSSAKSKPLDHQSNLPCAIPLSGLGSWHLSKFIVCFFFFKPPLPIQHIPPRRRRYPTYCEQKQ